MGNKKCESCGMPMNSIEDFGGSNPENKYCKYCTDEKGILKDFETKFKETTSFIISRMNVDKTVAEQIAKDQMLKLPAWKDCF